jgi:hypothetical protein
VLWANKAGDRGLRSPAPKTPTPSALENRLGALLALGLRVARTALGQAAADHVAGRQVGDVAPRGVHSEAVVHDRGGDQHASHGQQVDDQFGGLNAALVSVPLRFSSLRTCGAPVLSVVALVVIRALSSATACAALERVMNSIRKGLGIGKREIGREPSRPCNPHFYAVFAQIHNTL